MSEIQYKFNEEKLLQELKDYIDSTYDQHLLNKRTGYKYRIGLIKIGPNLWRYGRKRVEDVD